MGTISTLKKLGSILKKNNNLLKSYTVYNLFPNNFPEPGKEDDFNKKEFTKDGILMLNDCNVLMALGSATSSTKRKKVSDYNRFKRSMKTKSNSLVKAWNKAIELRPSVEDGSLDELKKSYETAKKDTSKLYPDAQKAKKLLADYTKEAESKKLSPAEVEEISKKIKGNTDKIEKIKEEWVNDCLNKTREEVTEEYLKKYTDFISSFESTFKQYSIAKKGKKGKETDESSDMYARLISKKYEFTRAESLVNRKVKKIYDEYCRQNGFEEWFKLTHEKFYDLYKSGSDFDVEISKQVCKKYPHLENKRKEALAKISALEREIKKLEQSRKNHLFKTFEDTPKSKKDALKDMKGASKDEKSTPEVREYTPEAEKLFGPIEKWMTEYREFERFYREYSELLYKCQKYFEAAKKAKEQFQSVVNDFQSLRDAKLIDDDYNEKEYEKKINKIEKSQEITLLQVVSGLMYYFQRYLKFYEDECKKYEKISDDISKLKNDYKEARQGMGANFSEVSYAL